MKKALVGYGEPAFRNKQIIKAVYRDGISSFTQISTISNGLRKRLKEDLRILPFKALKILEAKNMQSAKASLELDDGNIIETVLISPKPGILSVCVSTQAGCPMKCGFCATGMGGFKRNLTAEEIADQILFWKQYLKRQATSDKRHEKKHTPGHMSHVANVVYMGMGEPFLNWEQVRKSLEWLTDKDLFGFGSRSISVSTAGIPEGIMKFGENFPQMNLALSLHFADDKKRSEFMPVNGKYGLADLKKALQDYFRITKRKVFIEYIMLDKINDGKEDAEKLVQYLRSIGNTHLLHVNLIRYNTVDGKLKPSSGNSVQALKKYLSQNRINTTVRKSLGGEIQGACGQLSGGG